MKGIEYARMIIEDLERVRLGMKIKLKGDDKNGRCDYKKRDA